MKKIISSILLAFSGLITLAQEGEVASTIIDSSATDSIVIPKYVEPSLEVAKDYTIRSISIEGTSLNKSAILIRSGLSEGQKLHIPGDETSKAIRKLWESKFFTHVQLFVSKIEGENVDLLFRFKETPQVSSIKILKTLEGKSASKSDREDLEEILNPLTYNSYSKNIILVAESKIKLFYEEEGRLYPKITHHTVNDTTRNNKVILNFDIDEGPRVRIEDITFKGNRALPDNKLRKAMAETKRFRLWNVFKSSKLIDEEYQTDLEAVKAVYMQFGFRDMKIVKDTLIRTADNRIKVEITVNEGTRYYFRDINFSGNSKYTNEYLKRYLNIQKGDIYNEQRLQQRLSMDPQGTDISSLYLDDGYLFFNLEPAEVKVENDSIDLNVKIYEGKQAVVGRITIVGNTKTSDHVILREIYTKPGELFKRSDIIRSQRELANLKYFNPEKLQVNPKPNPVNGTVDIEFIVEEQPSDQFELQGGYGAGRVVGTLGLSFNNFSLNNFWKKESWSPIPSGDGQTLSIRAQSSGAWYQSYNFSFMEPWLGGKRPNSLSTSVYHTRLKSTSTDGHQYITGASLGWGTRLKVPDNFFRFQASLGYQHYDVFNYSGLNIAQEELGKFNNLNLKLTLSRSSIDQPIYPRSGGEFSLIGQFSLPAVSWANSDAEIGVMADVDKFKWIEYHKYKFHAGWFSKIYKNLVMYSKVNFGVLASYNRNIGTSPFERFYMGGSGLTGYNIDGREIIPLRGFTEANSSNIVYKGEGNNGGVAAIKYTFELRYPISLQPQATIYALAFAEAGNTYSSLSEFNPFDVKRTAGAGVRLFLPMLGMLGFDYGFPFNPANDVVAPKFSSFPGQFTFTFGGNLSGW
jgi:outer membrane protein insertion porin family